MSLQTFAHRPLPAKEKNQMVERRSVDYHPSLWEDYLAKYASPSNSMDNGYDPQAEQEIQKLKDEVKRMLCANADWPTLKLDMIDQIQRLGIAYHFASEIDYVLKQLNETCFACNNGDHDIEDLYTVALLFRLLRQQGYRISCGIYVGGGLVIHFTQTEDKRTICQSISRTSHEQQSCPSFPECNCHETMKFGVVKLVSIASAGMATNSNCFTAMGMGSCG